MKLGHSPPPEGDGAKTQGPLESGDEPRRSPPPVPASFGGLGAKVILDKTLDGLAVRESLAGDGCPLAGLKPGTPLIAGRNSRLGPSMGRALPGRRASADGPAGR